MAIRIGAVLVFKPEVTKEQAEASLESIRHLLDLPNYTIVKSSMKPFEIADKIHEFDDYDGSEGPVWYIP